MDECRSHHQLDPMEGEISVHHISLLTVPSDNLMDHVHLIATDSS